MSVLELRQDPAFVDLHFNKKNSLSYLWNQDSSLVGYTFEGIIYNSDKTIEESFTIENTDLANGQITIKLTKTQTDNLIEAGNIYEYYVDWMIGDERRTFIAGNAYVKEGIR